MRNWIPVGIAIWLTATLAGLAYFAQLRLVMFDPAMQLLSNAQSMQFDTGVADAFKARHGNVASTAFMIENGACRCTFAAKPHIARVGKLLREQNYATKVILADEHRYLAELVPATPALVIFDEQGRLSFLGPYSQGSLCTGNNGFVERFLSLRMNSALEGAMVINDARGCYCHT